MCTEQNKYGEGYLSFWLHHCHVYMALMSSFVTCAEISVVSHRMEKGERDFGEIQQTCPVSFSLMSYLMHECCGFY